MAIESPPAAPTPTPAPIVSESVIIKEGDHHPGFIEDPLMAALAADLSVVVKSDAAGKKVETPPIKPVVDPPVAPADPNKPAAIKATIRPRVDIVKEIDSAFKRNLPPLKADIQPLPNPKTDDLNREGLVDAQLEELDDALHAESKDPVKKGLAKKIHAFYREVDKWVADHKDDPDRTLDENDAELKEFIDKNKPKWAPGEREKIRRSRISDEVRESTMKEIAPKLEEAQREAREARVGPILDKQVAQFTSEFEEAAKSDDPFEKEVYSQFGASAQALAKDWLRLRQGLDKFTSPADRNQAERFKWLSEFVTYQANAFEKEGGNDRVRDGKMFATPAKYSDAIKAGKDVSNLWTFGDDDVLGILKLQMIEGAKSHIKTEEAAMTKRGFVKSKQAASPKPAEDPKPVVGVRASSTPAPGASNDNPAGEQNHFGRDIASALGL